MVKFKPSKELVVNEMLAEMDFGTTHTECKEINGVKWGLPATTFDRYWREALDRFQEANLKIKTALEEERIVIEKQRLKSRILDKYERMEILTDIAKGELTLTKHIVCDGIIQEREVVPDWQSRKAAIAELNKMDGEYAPQRKDITSGGEPLKQITGIIVE